MESPARAGREGQAVVSGRKSFGGERACAETVKSPFSVRFIVPLGSALKPCSTLFVYIVFSNPS